MISIISPAKSMNFDPVDSSIFFTEPEEFEETKKLLRELKALSESEIKKIMVISDELAKLNFSRYQVFESLPTKQAVLAYNGDVYVKMGKETFSSGELTYSQDHLRIISGFYGLLKPLDKIRAYRLEMSIKLAKNAPDGLDKLWKEKVTKKLNHELRIHKNKYLINLSSDEYSATIDKKLLEFPMINIHFRQLNRGVIKNIAFNSKHARGAAVEQIIRNKIDTPAEIKNFNELGYKFNLELSDEGNYYFVKQNNQSF
ncbi:MAG: YaaA family protein [Rickettsiaceae bacterium]|nr:YaaA family protein [Rickettsiaceae bacterium]